MHAHELSTPALAEADDAASQDGEATVAPRAPSSWRDLARHQAASFVATAFDFAVMVTLVELARLSPAAATAAGSACGAVINFSIGRHWTFGAAHGAASAQALRYALVSAMSLLLQSTGEHLLTRYAASNYVVARVALSIVVSLAWNFPMQRGYVFRRGINAAGSRDSSADSMGAAGRSPAPAG
jgi:putative flippase GtrA